MYYNGIDPDISGAICFFDEGKLLTLLKCLNGRRKENKKTSQW